MRIVPRPWLMLAVMVFSQASTTVAIATPAFLIPYLHEREGMDLASAGLLAGAPNLGLVLALFVWGVIADRAGERRVLLVGFSLSVLAVAASMLASDFVWLGIAFVVTGAMTACVNNTSGRLIAGWFPAGRRGLAMGIRQTCQPLGMAIAALAVPPIAAQLGIRGALAFGGVLLLASLVLSACVVVDSAVAPEAVPAATAGGAESAAPVAAGVSANPYRGSAVLARIHAASVLLVVPQFALSTFGLVWFTLGFHWSPLAAGVLVALAQFLGAGGRILIGVWSDRIGSRLWPLRRVAVAAAVAMLAAAGCGWADWSWAAAVVYVIASCISVADNGLSFTAVAEIAGPRWSGRALGVQNTGQFLAASAVGPAVGALIALLGVPAAFALVAVAPALAAPLVPSVRAERGAS